MKITTNNLVYKTLQNKIIDGISFSFDVSQKMAIYGPKNSGKRALLLIVGGYLKPTHGSVYLNGSNIFKNLKFYRRGNGVNEIIGVNQLVEEMTVRENILYSSKLYHKQINMDEIISKFELENFADTPINEVNQLVRAITVLVCATINGQTRIFLNEPTQELTDEAVNKYWQIINNNLQDRIIFFTTKSLVEARRADSVVELERGRLKKN